MDGVVESSLVLDIGAVVGAGLFSGVGEDTLPIWHMTSW
jgi:hypothetical protein